MSGYQIPHFGLGRQSNQIKEQLLEATSDVLSSGIYLDGPYTNEFEKWLRVRTGCSFAVTCHSGTQALEILARHEFHRWYDLFKTTPVAVVPNITYVATLNAFLREGFEVIIADTDKWGIMDLTKPPIGKGNILPHYYRPHVTPCYVGLFGASPSTTYTSSNHNGNFSFIVDGAQHWLIADPGEIGNGMSISFDPTKNLPSTGNGGAIITNDVNLWEFAMDIKNNGKTNHERVGTNSKMSEQECAQMLVRTKYIDSWQYRRNLIRHYYLEHFKDMPFTCLNDGIRKHSNQKFVIFTTERDELASFLESKGIETRIHYKYTLADLPISKSLKYPDILSVSRMLVRGLISLPIYPELTDAEVEIIASAVKEYFNKN